MVKTSKDSLVIGDEEGTELWLVGESAQLSNHTP